MYGLRVGKISAVLTFSVIMGWLVLWLGVGAPFTPHTILAQLVSSEQEWKTYYNADYRFAIDYPNFKGQTNITDGATNPNFTFEKKFYPPSYVGFVVLATKSPSTDPQESLIMDLQKKPDHHILLHGGVYPVIQDGVNGYAYSVLVNGTANMMTTLSFNHNGYLYYFIVSGLDGDMQTKGIKKVVESIKFFD